MVLRALLIADETDRIALALRRRLRTAAAIPARETFPRTHFTIGNDGAVVEAAILASGRWLDFDCLSGVLFRPGRAWRRRRVTTTVRQAFNRHERQAAWTAWLAALPCVVANRLPPAWFLAPDLYQLALAHSFATVAGLKAAGSHGPRGLAGKSVYFVGGQFVSNDSALEETVRISVRSREAVEGWCAEAGVVFGGIKVRYGHRSAEVEALNPAPSLRHATESTVDRIGRLLALRLA
jgi:hypothetical protein